MNIKKFNKVVKIDLTNKKFLIGLGIVDTIAITAVIAKKKTKQNRIEELRKQLTAHTKELVLTNGNGMKKKFSWLTKVFGNPFTPEMYTDIYAKYDYLMKTVEESDSFSCISLAGAELVEMEKILDLFNPDKWPEDHALLQECIADLVEYSAKCKAEFNSAERIYHKNVVDEMKEANRAAKESCAVSYAGYLMNGFFNGYNAGLNTSNFKLNCITTRALLNDK